MWVDSVKSLWTEVHGYLHNMYFTGVNDNLSILGHYFEVFGNDPNYKFFSLNPGILKSQKMIYFLDVINKKCDRKYLL